jgi:hypothetical protein
MDTLLDSFWMAHHDTAARAKKDAVLLALTPLRQEGDVHTISLVVDE